MFLSILLSMVMQLTVQSKSSVEQSGDVVGTARYACTYQKGQVRKADTATLVLSELGYLRLKHVKMSMKSNKSSGSGVLRMWLGETLVAEKQGSFADWTGSYSSDYVDVELFGAEPIENKGQNIRIELVGTENSLYVDHYDVEYESASLPCFSVRLHGIGGDRLLVEESGGAGVVLPGEENYGDMYWTGWTDVRVDSVSSAPEMWQEGTTFYPLCDTELWAVFSNVQTDENPFVAVRNYQSGYYVLALRATQQDDEVLVMSGMPGNGTVGGIYLPMNAGEDGMELLAVPSDEMVYYLSFDEQDSLVQVIHVATGSFVGASGEDIVCSDRLWRYAVASDTTLVLYVEEDGMNRLLGARWDEDGNVGFGLSAKSSPETLSRVTAKLWCVDADWLMQPVYWTTNPQRTALPEMAIDEQQKEYDFCFGVYKIHICGKKKTISLRR